MPNCTDIWKVEPRLDIFLIGGVGVTIVNVFGILGNVLTMLVLTRPLMKSSTTILLFGLSVCDLAFVTSTTFFLGFRELFKYSTVWRKYITTIYPVISGPMLPIVGTSLLGSIYFTVAVTVERFIVVTFPLRARAYCTIKNAVRTSVLIVGFAFVFNLPDWLGYGLLSSYEDRYVKGTWVCYQSITPEFVRNPNYVLYYVNWAQFIVYRLIPITLLSVLNWKIYKKLREANLSRQTMIQSEPTEISITRMLLVVVLVFLACYSFRIVIGLRESIFEGRKGNTPRIYYSFAYFFLYLNSAVNFIIYCLMGEKFRRTFIQLFSPPPMRGTGEIGSTNCTISTSILNPIPLRIATQSCNQRRLSQSTESISEGTATTTI